MLERGSLTEASKLLERSFELHTTLCDSDDADSALVGFAWLRARAQKADQEGRQRPAALATEAEPLRETLRAAGPGYATELAELERWLADSPSTTP